MTQLGSLTECEICVIYKYDRHLQLTLNHWLVSNSFAYLGLVYHDNIAWCFFTLFDSHTMYWRESIKSYQSQHLRLGKSLPSFDAILIGTLAIRSNSQRDSTWRNTVRTCNRAHRLCVERFIDQYYRNFLLLDLVCVTYHSNQIQHTS